MYKSKPDLYGPFWILTTLIVILAISANIETYIQLDAEARLKYQYNFSFVPVAIGVVYFIGFGLPLAIKLIMKFFGVGMFESSYIEVLGIYGYSFSSFLITCLLCAVPITIMQWIFIGYSMVISTLFLVVTYWNDLDKHLSGKARLAVIGLVSGT